MTYLPKYITITPEQIIAAAQKIANKCDDAWEYSEAQILAAVESYLRGKVSDILADVDWHANKDFFSLGTKQAPPSFVEEATELVVPPAPEWAHDTIAKPTKRRNEQIVQRRPLNTEPDGDVIYA